LADQAAPSQRRGTRGKPTVTADEYAALLRLDFYAFIERSFVQLNPDTRFYRNWHIELLAARLEAWHQGEIRRLIINLPPRNLKSHCASIALPAWILGHDPSAQILCVSYAQDLADKLARDCRSILISAWYQRLFRTRLSAQRQAVQEFVTTAQVIGCPPRWAEYLLDVGPTTSSSTIR
jgi:hypothetical protein